MERYLRRPVLTIPCRIPKSFFYQAEISVGPGISCRGKLKARRLLRIDGHFEGILEVQLASVHVGRSGLGCGVDIYSFPFSSSDSDTLHYYLGSLKADICGAGSVLVQGELTGNVLCREVIVIDGGRIIGDINCKSIFIDKGVEVLGDVNIHKLSPSDVDVNTHEVALDGSRYIRSCANGEYPTTADCLS